MAAIVQGPATESLTAPSISLSVLLQQIKISYEEC